MDDFPLTPGEAIVLATFLEDHAKLPHLVALTDRLRTWARANLTPAAEPEQPPTDRAWLETEDIRETPAVDLVAALRASVEAAKARRAAEQAEHPQHLVPGHGDLS